VGTESIETTIVVTTCDRPAVAERAVRSALAQTETRIEVIVVDDGSDAPFIPAISDERLRVVRTDGRTGVSAARNRGLGLARGRWITFLDDDDELLPHMVEASLTGARSSALPRPVAVVSGMEEIGPDGTIALTRQPVNMPRGRHYILEDLRLRDRLGLGAYNTLFAPVSVLRQIGGFDEEMLAGMHLDLMLRLNPVCSIEAVGEVGYRMYNHGRPRLSKQSKLRADARKRTYEKHRHLLRQHPGMIAQHLAGTGISYLRAGEWLRPVGLTAWALVRAPRRPGALRQLLFAMGGPRLLTWYERQKDRRKGSRSTVDTAVDGP